MSSIPDKRLNTVLSILYGTAFKFEETESRVIHALQNGYKGIDTAAVTRAYNENLAGAALRKVIEEGALTREEIWIQTKFSPHISGKDPAFFPYDVTTSIETQVSASIVGSLKHFTLPGSQPYLDAVVLHAPYPDLADTLTSYKALESFVPNKISTLGLSNIDIDTLREVYNAATVKPTIVQNRFTADIKAIPNPDMPPGIDTPEDRYDAAVREFCREKDIVYQPWGLLWGNANLLSSEPVENVAKTLDVGNHSALTACVQEMAPLVCILVGTSKEDRAASTIQDMARIKQWRESGDNEVKWQSWMEDFNKLLASEERLLDSSQNSA